MKVPDVEAKLVAVGLYPAVICGKDFGAFIQTKNEEYKRIIRDANIKVE